MKDIILLYLLKLCFSYITYSGFILLLISTYFSNCSNCNLFFTLSRYFSSVKVIVFKSLFLLSSSLLITSACFSYHYSVFQKAFPKGEYSNLLIDTSFSNKSFSDKVSLLNRNSYLLTFPDDKADNARFWYWLLWFSH